MLTVSDAAAQLNITSQNHDAELEGYVAAAVLVVERHTGLVPETRTITGELHNVPVPSDVLRLFHPPVQSLTAVTSADGSVTWDTAGLVADFDTGLVRVVSGRPLSGLVKVDYTAGYVDAPAHFRLAALIILQHLWETQRGAQRGAVAAGGLEDSLSNMVGGGRGYAIPNRALELLGEPAPVVA